MDHFIRNIWGSKFCSNNLLIKIKYVRSLLCSRVSQTQVWLRPGFIFASEPNLRTREA